MLPRQLAVDRAYHNGEVQLRLAACPIANPQRCAAQWVRPTRGGSISRDVRISDLAARRVERHQIQVVAAKASDELAYMIAFTTATS